MDIKTEYINSIQFLFEATLNKKIEWKRQNPTTLYFINSASGKKAIISIQKISNVLHSTSFGGDQYIFQIQNVETQDTIVSIEAKSSRGSQYYEPLRKLFSAAELSIDQKGLDFFNDILQNIR